MNQKERIRELKIEAAKTLKTTKCWVCGESYRKERNWKRRGGRSGFTIHHVTYRVAEKIHSDFPKTDKGRIEYYEYLIPILGKHPKKFKYLCNKCHINFSRNFSRRRLNPNLYRKMGMLRKITK